MNTGSSLESANNGRGNIQPFAMAKTVKDKDQEKGDEVLRRLLKTPPDPKRTPPHPEKKSKIENKPGAKKLP
ncbi:hypothetical protein ABUE29_26345 [Mesorhizobium sp. ZMM04-4]